MKEAFHKIHTHENSESDMNENRPAQKYNDNIR